MAKSSTKTAGSKKTSASSPPSRVEYLLGKATSRLLNARVNREEIHLLVNGPAMLYGTARILTSLDAMEGATFQAWTKLAAALTCTSYCGRNGKTVIPVEVETSRIGTCLVFSLGPMAMYQSQVVLRPKKKNKTMSDTIADAFATTKKTYSVLIIPEAATGHAEHDASIFEEPPGPGGGHPHGPHDHH